MRWGPETETRSSTAARRTHSDRDTTPYTLHIHHTPMDTFYIPRPHYRCSTTTVSAQRQHTFHHHNSQLTLPLRLRLLPSSTRVLPPPVLLDIPRFYHFPLQLRCIVDALRHMPPLLDFPDSLLPAVSLHKFLSVLDSLTLLGRNWAEFLGRIRFPYAHIAIIRRGENKVGSRSVADVEYSTAMIRICP